MRPLALLAGAALVLGACAAQPERFTVAEVNVDADLSSIGNPNSIGYWQTLDSDLEAAIASEFVGRIDPGGRTINVDVDELTLASALTTGFTTEDARLTGQVEVVNPDGSIGGTYNVSATSREAVTFLPPGSNITMIPPSSAEFYRAVVQAFARGTAEVVVGGS